MKDIQDAHIQKWLRVVKARIRASDYYYSNREKCIEQVKAYSIENADEKAKYSKDYRESHKSEVKAYNKEYREELKKDPIKHRQYIWTHLDNVVQKRREDAKEYALTHKAQRLENHKKWIEAHKEQHRISIESSNLFKKGVIPHTSCVKCGSNEDIMLFHVDYIDAMNCVCKCKECFWQDTKLRNREKKLNIIKEKLDVVKRV